MKHATLGARSGHPSTTSHYGAAGGSARLTCPSWDAPSPAKV